jgi:hypothetical protein
LRSGRRRQKPEGCDRHAALRLGVIGGFSEKVILSEQIMVRVTFFTDLRI